MRYHTNTKTIIISILVAFLFFASSVFILLFLNLTSPTLLVTNKILSSISSTESDISFKFDSVERNFRDKVSVKNFALYYKGDEIAEFDTIEIKLGLFDIIKYFLNLNGSLEIIFDRGNITLPSSLFSQIENSEDNTLSSDYNIEEKVSQFLSSHNVKLDFNSVDLSFPYGSGTIHSLSLNYIGKENKILGEGKIPQFTLSYSNYNTYLNDLSLSFTYGKSIFIKGNIGKTNLIGDDLNGSIESMSVKLSSESIDAIRNLNILGICTINSINGEYRGNTLRVKNIDIQYDYDLFSLLVDDISGSIYERKINVDNITGTLEPFDRYSLRIGDAEIKSEKTEFCLSPSTITGSIKEKEILLSPGVIDGNIANLADNYLDSIEISSSQAKISYTDGVKADISFSSSITSSNRTLEPLSFNSSISLLLNEGKIVDFNIDIKDLYSGWGEKFDSSLSLTGNTESCDIKLNYGAFSLDVQLRLREKRVEGRFNLDDYNVVNLLPFLKMEGSRIFDDFSSLDMSSSFNLSLNENNRIEGNLNYNFTLSSMHISALSTLLSSNGTLIFNDDKIVLDSVALDSSFFSFNASGYYDLEKRLPSIDFTSTLRSGGELLDGFIHLNNDRSYSYYGNFVALDNTLLKGIVDFNTDNIISSSSVLTTEKRERPFSLLVDLENKTIQISSDKLSFDISYLDGLIGKIKADNLDTLYDKNTGNALSINGEMEFSYHIGEGLVIDSSLINISNLFFLPHSPSMSFVLSGKDNVYSLNQLNIASTDGIEYNGRSSLDLNLKTLTFALYENNDLGSILFSLYKGDEFVAFLKGNDISLTPIGMDDMILSFNLFGRALQIEDFSFSGNMSVSKENSNERKMNAEITLNSSSLNIENIIYSSDTLEAQIKSLFYDAYAGKFGLDGAILTILNEKAERAYPISLSLSLSGETDITGSLLSSISSLISNKGNGTKLTLNLDYIDGDNGTIRVENKYADFSVLSHSVIWNGDFLTGYYSFDSKKAELSINLPDVTVASFKLDLSKEIEITASIKEFNMGIVNLLLKYPTLVFRDDLVKGEVSLTRNKGEYSMNGSLSTDELGCSVFWMEDQTLILHNARFIIWDNELSSSFTYATVFDHLTGERKMIKMSVGLAMNDTLSLERWEVDVYMDENNPIRVRLPLHTAGIDILSDVTGHYYAYDDGRMNNIGELNLSNTVLSIGMNPYPEWYNNITGGSDMDLKLNFIKNNSIKYPAGSDPIFTITLQENSSVRGYMDKTKFNFTGDVQIRGGEIFYFQKYFYITSGSIRFDDKTSFNPKISLRASLRDYDSSSEKVEIYLVMKDNTFDNLSPTLESSPQKELSEIMEILGQSILPQSAYGSFNASSAASLVTEGYDILSRLGIVTSSTNPLSSLSSSLKNVFGVDSFSLHSNILNNIVADTISQATSSYVTEYSPMARFLNGTTLNIGKYLSQNLYLQIMVHLEATRNNSSYTIISDDLALDTEFSLEWSSDAFNVTLFTKPSYFSFYSILSTFGFSITKIINF